MRNLYETLKQYTDSDAYPFHMPGHKRRITDFSNPYSIDITEIDDFDNLHHPEGILLEAQKRASGLYRSERTYYLVNGSTCGILSAISACVPRKGELLLARNCHKSAYHGAYLRELTIRYLYPQKEPEWGINGGISPEDVENSLKRYPDTKAVFLTSPTYDGIVSDIGKIAEAAHRHGCILIVDEAHGAHFGFHPYFPESALHQGADIVIHSLHKTLPSLTQTALLHVQGNRVPLERLERFLGIYQTSSPSYVFMAGMDRCVEYLEREGKAAFAAFAEKLEDFREEIRTLEKIRIPGDWKQGEYGIFAHDRSKLVLSVRGYQSGEWLYQKLRNEYGLQMEMAAGSYCLALTTLMDTREGFERLKKALQRIDREPGEPKKMKETEDSVISNEKVRELYEALETPGKEVPLAESEGRVSGEFLYLYPPGIPLLVPGERISSQLLKRIADYEKQGLSLQGLHDYNGRNIQIIDER